MAEKLLAGQKRPGSETGKDPGSSSERSTSQTVIIYKRSGTGFKPSPTSGYLS